MISFKGRVALFILFCVLFFGGEPVRAKDLVCGIAEGYAPYQFREGGRSEGFDADVIRLVLAGSGFDLRFHQDTWDRVVNELRSGYIDCVTGMEINELRKKYFDFTSPYYKRNIVIFIRADDDSIIYVEDLYGRVITGDRHSFVENYWKEKGIGRNIRIMQCKSKEMSMRLLHKGNVAASIMPKAVGLYNARKIGLKVRVLASPDPGSPVGIAVKKGNEKLLEMIEERLQDLLRKGEIDRLYDRWFGIGDPDAAGTGSGE